jgi:hypothetical protein
MPALQARHQKEKQISGRGMEFRNGGRGRIRENKVGKLLELNRENLASFNTVTDHPL